MSTRASLSGVLGGWYARRRKSGERGGNVPDSERPLTTREVSDRLRHEYGVRRTPAWVSVQCKHGLVPGADAVTTRMWLIPESSLPVIAALAGKPGRKRRED